MMDDITDRLEKLNNMKDYEELEVECDQEGTVVMRGMERSVKVGDTVHFYRTPEGWVEVLKIVPRTLH